jgi:RimJ/RimL family protein N-acetyltransferase
MEILYQINSLEELKEIQFNENVNFRWLKVTEDYEAFCECLHEQHPNSVVSIDELLEWKEQGIIYCGIFKDRKIIARAAAEKYSEDKWETADVRVSPLERGKGYAKQICYYVTKYILENNKSATCRTEEYNIPMQHVIKALGYKLVKDLAIK